MRTRKTDEIVLIEADSSVLLPRQAWKARWQARRRRLIGRIEAAVPSAERLRSRRA